MRPIGFFKVLCTACTLGLEPGAAYAQAAPPTVPPGFATETFSRAELLSGTRITEAACAALPTAVWVVVGGQGECIRYYHSDAGGSGREALVYLSADVASVNGRGEMRPNELYLKESPAGSQNGSSGWSRSLRMPYLLLGRPGTFGSSGEHAKRRTAREIDVVSAALDAIKVRHGYARLHVTGYAEGGHTAAALLSRRTDLGCVVLASALISVRDWLSEFDRSDDVTGNKAPIDPVALVDRVAKRSDLRIFVVTDPDDVVISAGSQTNYAKRAAAAGLPVRQVFTAAPDPYAHALGRTGREIAASCAKGMSDDAIVAKFQNKVPEIPPDADEPRLHAADVLTRGIALTELQCKGLASAAWVRVEDRTFCVRYWMSAAGGKKEDAMVFLDGDLGETEKGTGKLNSHSARVTSGSMQRNAQLWSRIYGGPYVVLGRPGTFGSSGHHGRDRRTPLEVKVVMAALDALKDRHGFKRFHMIGQSGGGHTVAAMAQMRGDMGCSVMASGVLSVKSRERDLGNRIGTKISGSYDPIDFVGAMRHQPGRRMIVISDPDDRVVAFRSQREFVDRVKAKGVPILHITMAAGDDKFHGLSSQGRQVAVECAKDVDDEALTTKFQTKAAPVVSRR
jgi:dienelactone hydrolase